MKFCGFLKQNTAAEKLIGQLFSFNDGKTTLSDAVNGNNHLDASLIKCTLTKNTDQSLRLLATRASGLTVSGDCTPDITGDYYYYGSEYVRKDNQYKFVYDSQAGIWKIYPVTNPYGLDLFVSSDEDEDSDYTATYGTGQPIVSFSLIGSNFELISGGMAKINFTAEETNTEGVLAVSFENSNPDNPLIFADAFYWLVLNETAYNQMFGINALATAAQITALNNLSAEEAESAAAAAITAAELATTANQTTINSNVVAVGNAINGLNNLSASQAKSSAAIAIAEAGLATSAQIVALNNISAADVINALKNATGFTVGGTWTFTKIMKVIAALFAGGNWRLKTDQTNIYQILDAEDSQTVVAEATISESGTILSMSIKI